jgi:hypothetical protein
MVTAVLIYAKPVQGMGWQHCDPAELIGAPDYFNGREVKTDADGMLLPPRFMRPVYWMINPDIMRVMKRNIDGQPGLLIQIYRAAEVHEDAQINQACKMAWTLAKSCGYARFALALKHQTADPFPASVPSSVEGFPAPMTEDDETALEKAVQYLRETGAMPEIVVAGEKDADRLGKRAEAEREQLRVVKD